MEKFNSRQKLASLERSLKTLSEEQKAIEDLEKKKEALEEMLKNLNNIHDKTRREVREYFKDMNLPVYMWFNKNTHAISRDNEGFIIAEPLRRKALIKR